MILTLTPNPSMDTTMQLRGPLKRGAVQRPDSVTRVAGGKGVNVTHAVQLAGRETLAIFPARDTDPFTALVREAGLPFHSVAVAESVRINNTLTEPDGTTTKINGPGAFINQETRLRIKALVIELAGQADWLVMAGSLPPGIPATWYTTLITAVRAVHPDLPIAVDTSDTAMIELGRALDSAAPTLIKPNGMELGQLVGEDGEVIEEAAAAGDFEPAVSAARRVVERGVAEVLVTLGPSGAVLVTEDGGWHASPPPVTVASTVGAGDSSLAGYIMGRVDGASPADCLIRAVAYGSAAAALPGTTMPTPDLINLVDTHVRALSGAR